MNEIIVNNNIFILRTENAVKFMHAIAFLKKKLRKIALNDVMTVEAI